jgi:hypothetical protein
MWIFNPDFITFHKARIAVGTKGFFMEGLMKTAECEVIEAIGLLNH